MEVVGIRIEDSRRDGHPRWQAGGVVLENNVEHLQGGGSGDQGGNGGGGWGDGGGWVVGVVVCVTRVERVEVLTVEAVMAVEMVAARRRSITCMSGRASVHLSGWSPGPRSSCETSSTLVSRSVTRTVLLPPFFLGTSMGGSSRCSSLRGGA